MVILSVIGIALSKTDYIEFLVIALSRRMIVFALSKTYDNDCIF